MNTTLSLQVLYVIYTLSILIYAITIIVSTAFVIPLQKKEAQVRNGLAPLRRMLLKKGFLALIVAATSIIALTTRFFSSGDVARYVTIITVFANSIGNLSMMVIDSVIYRQNYSEESIERHRIMEEMESKAKN